jgi:RNA polymerase sigma factor (TIGR02999 family)
VDPTPAITRLLAEARRDDGAALEALLPLVYDELRLIARRHRRREGASPTFSTTVVVHEAYLRVFGAGPAAFHDRRHFFAVASLAMRHLLRDGARRRLAARRGQGADHTGLTGHDPAGESRIELLLEIDEALTQLRTRDPRLAEVVELRYFGGLTGAEIAELLGVTERTIERDWRRARALLSRALSPDPAPPRSGSAP